LGKAAEVVSFIQVAQFSWADLITGCVGNVSEELDFSFRYVRGFGAKFLLLQALEDSPHKFKDLLFHSGSPPCFLPFDLLLGTPRLGACGDTHGQKHRG
jgi:hypothetical protein